MVPKEARSVVIALSAIWVASLLTTKLWMAEAQALKLNAAYVNFYLPIIHGPTVAAVLVSLVLLAVLRRSWHKDTHWPKGVISGLVSAFASWLPLPASYGMSYFRPNEVFTFLSSPEPYSYFYAVVSVLLIGGLGRSGLGEGGYLEGIAIAALLLLIATGLMVLAHTVFCIPTLIFRGRAW
jgi:hypothetical protein